MRFPLLVLSFIVFTSYVCHAQSSVKDSKFNLGFEMGIPFSKDFKSTYKNGFGGSLKYEYRADSNFYFTISVGYMNYPFTDATTQEAQQAGSSKTSGAFMPIKIGGKFYIVNGLFGEVQLGNTFPLNAHRSDSATASAFTFAPGIGYAFNNGLEMGARYEGWLSKGIDSQYALHVSYRFKL